MSTFLQLMQRLCRECGTTSSTPSTTVGQTGELRRMVDWLNAAYVDTLGAHQDWGFLRTSTSFVTVAGQAIYTTTEAGTTNFGMWEKESFRNYPTATGTVAEIRMQEAPYDKWRDLYQFGANRTATSQPHCFAITPAKSIGLGPVPPAGYTITADYFTSPAEMALDADVPVIPSQYQLVIVYRAMMMYGEYEAAQEVFVRGKREFSRLMKQLEADYLSEFCVAGPLV